MRLQAALLGVLLLCTACAAPAARTFSGVVTRVSDGDTVWVRPAAGGAAVPVRIEGIDAPEICQAHGPQARDALAGHLLRQPVTVHARAKDDYDRILGRVQLDGDDVGAWLVERGHAWSYRYRGNPGAYAVQQAHARQARRGLWAAASPTEPRTFRGRHGSCRDAGR